MPIYPPGTLLPDTADPSRLGQPTTGAPDWKAGLADPDKQWRAGYSAMAAAQSWQAAQDAPSGLPPEIAALLGPGSRLEIAVPEHKVPMPGRGADSQCDVFALVDTTEGPAALAVEAKVNEPFGPLLSEWLGDAPSVNKQERLDTICGWLGVETPPDPDLRYQLFHRTAAAVVEARRFKRPIAVMLVQSFSPLDRWLEDFRAFARALDIDAGPGRLGRKTLPDGLQLWLGWARGAPQFLEDLGRDGGPDG